MADSASFPHATDPDALGYRLLQKAHVRDGLPEIYMGIFFLLGASLTYAVRVLPKESPSFRLAVLASAFLLPAVLLSGKWVLKWLRRHFLIEQWGFVEYRLINGRRIALGIAFAAVFTLVLFGVVPRLSQPEAWRLAAAGLFGGAVLAWGGRLPRFVIQGALWALGGVLLALSGVPEDLGFTMLFGSYGLVALISGSLVLRRFLRQPVARPE